MRRLKREPAADLATAELRTAILTGVLRPGTRVRQEELADRLGVSRMPIRQALTVLEREGFVKTDRWRGTVITPLDADLIRDVYKFREILERYVAATLAQQDFNSAPVREVLTVGRQAVATGDIARTIDLDLRFHTKLYDAVGNAVLSEVMRGQWGHIRRVMSLGVMSAARIRSEVWDEHAAIVDAIDAHDVEEASSLATQHITQASVIALRNLENLTG